jgi:dephospho-CoA kinase
MLVVGVAGGIACGKSLVARQFQRLGAVVLDVDQIGHRVLHDPEVLEAIKAQWGDSVLTESGNIDRKALARIVFALECDGRPTQLEILEKITHPKITRLLKAQLSELQKDESIPAVVLDAPVMFKTGWDKFCDKIVFVDVPFELRAKRARETRNWSIEELTARESRQMPLSEKQKRATNTIDNSGTPQQLFEQILNLWKRWGLKTPA